MSPDQPRPTDHDTTTPIVQVDARLHSAGNDGDVITRKTGTRQFVLIDFDHDNPNPGDVKMTITTSAIGDTPPEIAEVLRDAAEYLDIMKLQDKTDRGPTP